MSFNLRFATAPDGEHRWECRQDLVHQAIRAFAPDVLGTQECLAIDSRMKKEIQS